MESLDRERAEHAEMLEQSCAVVLELITWEGYTAEPGYTDDFVDMSSGLAGIMYYLYRHRIRINRDAAKGILWGVYAQMSTEEIPNDDLFDKCAYMVEQAVNSSWRDTAQCTCRSEKISI